MNHNRVIPPSTTFWWWDDAVRSAVELGRTTGRKHRVFWSPRHGAYRVRPALMRVVGSPVEVTC